jgi:hypothetical protein
MSLHPSRHPAGEVFESFVRELARSPQRSHILTHLTEGHHKNRHG